MPVESYLDEGKLQTDDVAADFLSLSQLFAKLLEVGIRTHKRSTIYEAPVTADLDLLTLLFHVGHIDEDLRLALMVQLDQMPNWDDGLASPIPSTEAYSILRRLAGVAILRVMVERHAHVLVENDVYLVGSLERLRVFLRALPELLDLSEEAYIEHCKRIFDRLVFKPDIQNEIRRFSRRYRDIRGDLHSALMAINDILSRLLDEEYNGAELAARFEALTHFGLSPESVQTRRDRKAMKEREIIFNRQPYVCEWHVKIQPQIDRIHLHFFDPNIGNGNQILVGIFCDHLT